MIETPPDISAIIVAHHEGVMAGLSLRSFLECAREAESAGITVQKIAVLDRPNLPTRQVFEDAGRYGMSLHCTDFGDQGLTRNEAVRLSSGKTIAFLDGDDLWGYNWLRQAWQLFLAQGERTIVHPEFNWFFQGNRNILIQVDQTDMYFDVEFLRYGNYWDALCLAPRSAMTEFPYCKRDIAGGYAYEDWQWNCETLAASYVHRVAGGTIHFKRRRPGSQTLVAAGRRALMRQTKVTDYSWCDSHSIVPAD